MYNRQKRVEEDKQKKNILKEKYRIQKRKTQYIIKEAITAHERKITTDIRNNKGHKKLWDIMNTLRGKKRNTYKEEYMMINITKLKQNNCQMKSQTFGDKYTRGMRTKYH